jgi:hypothetical protein
VISKIVRLQKMEGLFNMLLEFKKDEKPSNGNSMLIDQAAKVVQRRLDEVKNE